MAENFEFNTSSIKINKHIKYIDKKLKQAYEFQMKPVGFEAWLLKKRINKLNYMLEKYCIRVQMDL